MRTHKDSARKDPLDILSRKAEEKSVDTAHEAIKVPLAKMMNADLIINRHSQVMLAHDKPFPGVLQWVEYDVDMGSLIFVLDDGKMQDFGMKVAPVMGRYLERAEMINTVLVVDKKMKDYGRVPLLVRDTIQ